MSNNKKNILHIRLSDRLYNKLYIQAEELDMTISEYVRAILTRYL